METTPRWPIALQVFPHSRRCPSLLAHTRYHFAYGLQGPWRAAGSAGSPIGSALWPHPPSFSPYRRVAPYFTRTCRGPWPPSTLATYSSSFCRRRSLSVGGRATGLANSDGQIRHLLSRRR